MISDFYARGKRKYRIPEKLAGPEWLITGKADSTDQRVREGLLVSYGYIHGNSGKDSRGLRDISLRIDNRVVILDPLDQNALIKLLLAANG